MIGGHYLRELLKRIVKLLYGILAHELSLSILDLKDMLVLF
jgi:hypothetical protein